MPNRALGPPFVLSLARPFEPHERDALVALAQGQPDQPLSPAALAALGDAELVAAAGFTRWVD